MLTRLQRLPSLLARWFSARVNRDFVARGKLRLPPRRERRCTAEWQDDDHFVASARTEVARLQSACGLSSDSSLLDLGCGPARLAIGIQEAFGGLRRYEGIDVSRWNIAWAKRHIERKDPRFRFTRIDVFNERYNPAGTVRLDHRFRFPFEDHVFDVIFAYSLFTHMRLDDTRVYFRELGRLLAPGGRAFVTAYLHDGPEEEVVNPSWLGLNDDSPLLRVQLARRTFVELIATSGLALLSLDLDAEFDRQSGVLLTTAGAT